MYRLLIIVFPRGLILTEYSEDFFREDSDLNSINESFLERINININMRVFQWGLRLTKSIHESFPERIQIYREFMRIFLTGF